MIAIPAPRPCAHSGPAVTWPATGLALLLAVLPAAPAWSAPGLTLTLGDVSGHGISLYDVELALDADPTQGGQLRIARAQLPAPVGQIETLQLDCARVRLTTRNVRCQGGNAAFSHGAQVFSASPLELRIGFDGSLSLQFAGTALAGGQLAGLITRDAAGTLQAQFDATRLDLAELAAFATLASLADDGLLADASLAGSVGIDAQLRLGTDGRLGAEGHLVLNEVTAASADGRAASEAFGLDLAWRLTGFTDSALALDLSAMADRGQVYVEPVFLDLAAGPIALDADLLVEGSRLTLTRVALRDGEDLSLQARGAMDADGSGWLAITQLQARLPATFERYVQPFLLGSPLDNLQSSGSLSATARIEQGRATQLGLNLDAVSLRTRDDALALSSVDARLDWRHEGSVPTSWLRWHDGRLYNLALGPTELGFTLQGERLSAPGRQRIPLLDGALVLTDIEATGLGRGLPDFSFDAQLEPVSLALLTEALGWPTMGGSLAGVLPGASYRDRVLESPGELVVEVFGGHVNVDALRIEALLSPLPRLTADIVFRNLDLEQLTGTFAFGQITGRLDGEILGLRLLNWRPSAFAARMATPADYRGPRRISQRAVDNLTSIGGGMGAGLSGGFMRFFDDFNYDRLGISCTLRNEICQMDGVAPVNGGYYIVRGRGLPRINVIGGARRVSWPVLLRQLASLDQLDQAVVQ